MIPYNRKMFGEELNQLGTYWLDKLPNVSFDETLISCLSKKAFGQQPGHAQFYYPKKYGYGELWLRMAQNIENNIEYGKSVIGIDFNKNIITTADGCKYQADVIITSIPWLEFERIEGMPKELSCLVKKLKYTSIQVEYFKSSINTDAHWIYYPDDRYKYHRILVRHNFAENSSGYWTETNCAYINEKKMGDNFSYISKYAYPLNTVDKPKIMKMILEWCNAKSVYGLGRWGEHQHYNSDLTVELAMKMADKLYYKYI